ncbi:MAG: hypothetical protein M0P61_00515 [Ignavibacteriaceae bacterium]|jgi:hypothetical protein|nr:hypothetical protein [Ignavibacteriaceae bacterium]
MKTNIKTGLKLNDIEYLRFQELINRNHYYGLDTLVETYGLLVSKTDTSTYGTEWLVTQLSTWIIQVNVGKGIAKGVDGNPHKIALTTPLQIDLTAYSAGTYKLLASHTTTNYEEGTVSLTNASATVYGVSTKFTEIFGVNRKIIVSGVAYNILSVQSNTELTLETAYVGTDITTSQFKVGGWIIPDPGVADSIIYEYDILAFRLTTGAATATEYQLATVVVEAGGVTSITDARSTNIFKLFLNAPTILGTPASTFQVGGRYVKLEEDIPQPIKNIRIVDITGIKLKYVEDVDNIKAKISDEAYSYSTNKLRVYFKWGYDDVVGTGAVNTFTLTGKTFTLNELANYFIYIPSLSKNLLIESNLATASGNTVLTVKEIGGGDWDGTGVVVTSENPAIIHNGADEYDFIAVPQYASAYDYNGMYEKFVKYASSPTAQSIALDLELGCKYLVKVRAGAKGEFNSFVEMSSGSFTKYSASQAYAKPFLVKHPDIPTAGAIGSVATRNGFRVDVSGWTEAEQFEIVYTTKNSGASFTDVEQEHKTIYNSKYAGHMYLDIPTSISANYNIAVRPLIAGQQVSAPLTTSVVSGSAGNLPGDQVIASVYINHRTFSGSLSWNNTLGIGTLSTVVTPASGTQSVTSLPELEGCILSVVCTDGAVHDFIISSVLSSLSIELTNLTGASYIPADGAFTIGVSERGRLAFQSNKATVDYEIVRVDTDCDVKRGENLTLRVYQIANKASYDSIIITTGDTPFTMDCDVLLLGVFGDRNWAIDFFDPATSGALNKGCFSGQITVFARPYSRDTRKTVEAV